MSSWPTIPIPGSSPVRSSSRATSRSWRWPDRSSTSTMSVSSPGTRRNVRTPTPTASATRTKWPAALTRRQRITIPGPRTTMAPVTMAMTTPMTPRKSSPTSPDPARARVTGSWTSEASPSAPPGVTRPLRRRSPRHRAPSCSMKVESTCSSTATTTFSSDRPTT